MLSTALAESNASNDSMAIERRQSFCKTNNGLVVATNAMNTATNANAHVSVDDQIAIEVCRNVCGMAKCTYVDLRFSLVLIRRQTVPPSSRCL